MNARPLPFGMSKQEALSWLGLLLFGAGSLYLVLCLFSGDGVGIDNDTARTASRAGAVFFVVSMLIRRRDRTPLIDERDRVIAARRTEAGYAALCLTLLFVATLLGLEGWREAIVAHSAAWLESVVMLMLLASLTMHAAVGVWHYLRDRL